MKSVFISSTFKDMQAERDCLHEIVFPSLNRELMSTGETIQELDLRWGVNTLNMSEEESGKEVLKVCIDAIDRCRPFTVVLLGERYGWIPDYHIVNETNDTRITDLYREGSSITNLEIDYAALRDAHNLDRCVFCFRDSSFIENLPEDMRRLYEAESEVHRTKLNRLKKEIRQLENAVILDYSVTWDSENGTLAGLEAFAQNVQNILLEMIRKEYGDRKPATETEKIQAVTDSMCEYYLSSYIPRAKEEFEILMRLITEGLRFGFRDRQKMIIHLTGDAGSGKSALMSAVAKDLTDAQRPVILYYCGAPGCGNIDTLKKMTVAKLQEVLKVREELPASLNEKLKYLSDKIDRQKIYCIIDGLDQLFDRNRELYFDLFTLCPRLIYVVSSVPEFPLESIVSKTQLGLRQICLSPLSGHQTREIIARTAGKRGKRLDDEIVNGILNKAESRNPLYLSIMLQRFFMMDSAEFAEAENMGQGMEGIHRYMEQLLSKMPDDKREMVRFLLNAIQRKFDEKEFTILLKLIASSLKGLTETELENILKTDQKDFSQIRFQRIVSYLFDAFSVQEDGKWNFSHRLYKESVLADISDGTVDELLAAYALSDPSFRKKEGYYYIFKQKLPEGGKVLKELAGTDDSDLLCECMAGMMKEDASYADYFSQLTEKGSSEEMVRFWIQDFGRYSYSEPVDRCYRSILHILLNDPETGDFQKAEICSILADISLEEKDYAEVLEMIKQIDQILPRLPDTERAYENASARDTEARMYSQQYGKENLVPDAIEKCCWLYEEALFLFGDRHDRYWQRALIRLVNFRCWRIAHRKKDISAFEHLYQSLKEIEKELDQYRTDITEEKYYDSLMYLRYTELQLMNSRYRNDSEKLIEIAESVIESGRQIVYQYPTDNNLANWGCILESFASNYPKHYPERIKLLHENRLVWLRLDERQRTSFSKMDYINALISLAESIYSLDSTDKESQELWEEAIRLLRDLKHSGYRGLSDAMYGYKLLKYCRSRMELYFDARYWDTNWDICSELLELYQSDSFDDGGYPEYVIVEDLRDIYYCRGRVSIGKGDKENACRYMKEACSYSAKALQYREDRVNVKQGVNIIMCCIKILLRSGRPQEVFSYRSDLLKLIESIPDLKPEDMDLAMGEYEGYFGRACLETGNIAQAEKHMKTADSLLSNDEKSFRRIWLLLLKADVLAAWEDYEASVSVLAEAEDWLRETLDSPLLKLHLESLQSEMLEYWEHCCKTYESVFRHLHHEDPEGEVQIKRNEMRKIMEEAEKRGYVRRAESAIKKSRENRADDSLEKERRAIRSLWEQSVASYEKTKDADHYRSFMDEFKTQYTVEIEETFDMLNGFIRTMKETAPEIIPEIEQFEQDVYVHAVRNDVDKLRFWEMM